MNNKKKFSSFKGKYAKIVYSVVLLIMAVAATVVTYYDKMQYSDWLEQTENRLSVHYIDVGQGDATLLIAPDGKAMLVDSGNTDSAEYLLSYLKRNDVDSLEYFIITHPHEDHYGGAEKVISDINVENFVIHKDFSETYPFDRFVYMLENKKNGNTNIVKTQIDDEFTFANDVNFKILSPENVDYDDLNESSLAFKVVYGDTAFLFTGDCEKTSEKTMLSKEYDISCNVFKAGHHGSSTSNTKKFMQKANPEFVVISCGKDNSYGHPHKNTMKTLKELNIETHRTDIEGNIVFVSDGKTVSLLDNTMADSDNKSETAETEVKQSA